MTEVFSERGRSSIGGYGRADEYHARSRSRGELLEPRGEKYGRATNNIRTERKDESAVPEKEMHGGGYKDDKRGGGYNNAGGGKPGGDRGGYRDQGDYRTKGNYGAPNRGGAGGQFQKPSNFRIVSEGQTSQLHSNHFRFGTRNLSGNIFIYKADFGATEKEDCFAVFRSLISEFERIFFKYMTYGKLIFSPT